MVRWIECPCGWRHFEKIRKLEEVGVLHLLIDHGGGEMKYDRLWQKYNELKIWESESYDLAMKEVEKRAKK